MLNQEPQVIHDAESQQFKIIVNAQTAVLDYRQDGGILLFTHTGVPPALEGQGIGSRLAQAGLDYARTNGLKVQSLCWFVDGYLKRHPEYQDLLG
jgi:predicted GNAT family acetyltransferase